MENVSQLNLSDLNWFDIMVISTVIISTLFAFFRGFIRVTMSLITWGTAATITVALYPEIFSFLKTRVDGEKAAMAIASLGTFTVVFVVLAIISLKIISLLDRVEGGIIDRLLGFTLGFFRGIVIVCLVFFSINMTSKTLRLGSEDRPGPKWFAEAKTYNMLNTSTTKGLEYLPDSLPKEVIAYADKFKEVSVSMVENEMDGGNNFSGTLNEEERKIMKQVIVLLPKEELSSVYAKYDSNSSFLSDLERMSIFREILKLYKDAVAAGKVDKGRMVPQSDIEKLEKALQIDGIPAEKTTQAPVTEEEGGAGYKQNNIQQMDRLINNIQAEGGVEQPAAPVEENADNQQPSAAVPVEENTEIQPANEGEVETQMQPQEAPVTTN